MKILLAVEARRSFEHLPRLIKVRFLGVFGRLKSWPDVSGARPLRGRLWGQYRMRSGDYRIQFRVEREGIMIVKVGHRDGFHDE